MHNSNTDVDDPIAAHLPPRAALRRGNMLENFVGSQDARWRRRSDAGRPSASRPAPELPTSAHGNAWPRLGQRGI